ncbi:response regulator [bacterium]|nr:response regulator [bacterium]
MPIRKGFRRMNQFAYFFGIEADLAQQLSGMLGLHPLIYDTESQFNFHAPVQDPEPILAVIDADRFDRSSQFTIRLKDHLPELLVVIVAEGILHGDVVQWLRANVSDVIPKAEIRSRFVPRIQELMANLRSKDGWEYMVRRGIPQYLIEDQEHYLKQKIQSVVPTIDVPEIPEEPRATVLLVDDEPWMRRSYSVFLKDKFIIEEAEDGEMAVERVKSNPAIDVVILDVRMPKLRGDEALAKIKQFNPSIEVIILTAFEDTEVAIQILRSGGNDYLNKPVTKDALIQKVKAAVEIKRTRQYFGIQMPFHRRKYLFYQFVVACRATGTPIRLSDVRQFLHEFVDHSADDRELTLHEIEMFMDEN